MGKVLFICERCANLINERLQIVQGEYFVKGFLLDGKPVTACYAAPGHKRKCVECGEKTRVCYKTIA